MFLLGIPWHLYRERFGVGVGATGWTATFILYLSTYSTFTKMHYNSNINI